MIKSGKAMSMPAGIAMGIGICILITLFGAVALTWMVSSERLAEDAVGYGCMVILPVAAAGGCMSAGGAVKHRKLMVCGICAAGYYFVLLMTALLFGGQFEGIGVTALMILAGGGISLIPSAAGTRSGAHRRKIKGYR